MKAKAMDASEQKLNTLTDLALMLIPFAETDFNAQKNYWNESLSLHWWQPGYYRKKDAAKNIERIQSYIDKLTFIKVSLIKEQENAS